MPNWTKALVGFLFILLIGVTAYLGYQYFTRTQTQKEQGIPASGQISETPKPDRSKAISYQGTILCIEEGGTATGTAGLCTKGLYSDDGKSYEIRDVENAGVDNFAAGDRVRISGVLEERVSTLGLEGVLNVFEISKL